MFDYRKIKSKVIDYAGDFAEEFDIDGVMSELRDLGICDLDDIDHGDLDDILARNDVSGK